MRTLWDCAQGMAVLGLSLLPVSVSLGVGPRRPRFFHSPKATNSPVAGSMQTDTLQPGRCRTEEGGWERRKRLSLVHILAPECISGQGWATGSALSFPPHSLYLWTRLYRMACSLWLLLLPGGTFPVGLE